MLMQYMHAVSSVDAPSRNDFLYSQLDKRKIRAK